MSRRLTRRVFLKKAGVATWGAAKYSVHDGTRSVLNDCVSLFPQPPKPL